MSWLAELGVAVWAWGWGWWSHDASPLEVALAAFWPVLWPLGHLYHWWRWGPSEHRRYVYSDTRWWQRGATEPLGPR